MGSRGIALVGGLGGTKPPAQNDFKLSRALYLSPPETCLHIFKLQFNRKTAFKYKQFKVVVIIDLGQR